MKLRLLEQSELPSPPDCVLDPIFWRSAGSSPEPPPPSNCASQEEDSVTLAVPLDLVFALSPLLLLAVLLFLGR